MKRKVIAPLLILIGISIILYPVSREAYYDYQQQKLIKEWQQSLAIIDANLVSAEEHPDSNAEDYEDLEALEQERQRQVQEREAYIQRHMEGILKIEKIRLNMPILTGATERNLNISISSLENTGQPGEVGNYALAGHRSHSYGRHFNRLEELEIGDLIEIDTGNNNFQYTVVEKLYVQPEETWVLEDNHHSKEITLITCHPMIKPTERLIIKGKITD